MEDKRQTYNPPVSTVEEPEFPEGGAGAGAGAGVGVPC